MQKLKKNDKHLRKIYYRRKIWEKSVTTLGQARPIKLLFKSRLYKRKDRLILLHESRNILRGKKNNNNNVKRQLTRKILQLILQKKN